MMEICKRCGLLGWVRRRRRSVVRCVRVVGVGRVMVVRRVRPCLATGLCFHHRAATRRDGGGGGQDAYGCEEWVGTTSRTADTTAKSS